MNEALAELTRAERLAVADLLSEEDNGIGTTGLPHSAEQARAEAEIVCSEVIPRLLREDYADIQHWYSAPMQLDEEFLAATKLHALAREKRITHNLAKRAITFLGQPGTTRIIESSEGLQATSRE